MKFLRLIATFLWVSILGYYDSELNAQACYELILSEEFNYSGRPDSTVWTQEVGGNGWGNNELQYYTEGRPENARVEDGHLVIEAIKEPYEGNSYTSARLITYQNGLSFKYGKMEARMKLPYGQGIWPAFWMLGGAIFEGTPWPACGEIDIMEMVGGGPGRDDLVHGTIHWSDAGGNHAQYGGQKQLEEGVFADTFHVFSIEWNANTIKWFLDGIQYHVVDITPGDLNEFHENFFILLNLAVGGNWPGSPDASTVFPQRMYVDYVRVYQLDTAPGIKGDTVVIASEKGVRFSTVESVEFTYSWSVPPDAEILKGEGTPSILVDWGCDTGTVSCSLTTLCGAYELEHKVGLEELQISGKDQVELNDSNLTYSIPLSGGASHEWLLPDGVVLNSENDTNSINVNWTDQDGEIVLMLSNSCGADTASLQISVFSQLPYPDPDTPHLIPGTIESVHYDSGGEGISYHDYEPENLGPGSRQDEGVDTEPNDGSENIGWLEPGEWLEYTIEVEKTGLYDVEIRAGSINSTGKLKLLFNGEERSGEVAVPLTGSWTTFTTIQLSDIQLYNTDQLMRIHIVNGQFNMGRLNFREASPSLVESVERIEVYVYPSVTNRYIFVKNIDLPHQYSISDMMGRLVQTGVIEPDAPVDVGELVPGGYFLFLERDQNFRVAGRFHKAN